MSTFSGMTYAPLLAAGVFLLSSPAGSTTVLSASSGSAWDPLLTHCFHRGWNEPGRVTFGDCPIPNDPDGADYPFGNWDMRIPLNSTGTKWFGVYGKDSNTFIESKCLAMVVDASGAIARWKELIITPWVGWHNFCPVAVNTNESIVISCGILHEGISENWFSAVRVLESSPLQCE
jgi:hypothetical protein